MGDALAVSLMRLRGFHPEDFARLHPGGSLGRRLTGRVRNTMISKPLPVVSPQDTLMDCVLALARAQLPVVLVVDDEQQRLCGIVSEADLRVKADEQCMQTPAERLMKTPVPVIDQDAPLHEAELRFERDEVEALVALDGDGHISGVLTRNQEG
jgi:arabinose-5-phosphate isomerase